MCAPELDGPGQEDSGHVGYLTAGLNVPQELTSHGSLPRASTCRPQDKSLQSAARTRTLEVLVYNGVFDYFVLAGRGRPLRYKRTAAQRRAAAIISYKDRCEIGTRRLGEQTIVMVYLSLFLDAHTSVPPLLQKFGRKRLAQNSQIL